MNKATLLIIIALVLVLIGAWAIFSYSNQRYLSQNPENNLNNQQVPNQGMSDMGAGETENNNPAAAALTKSDNGEGNVSVSLTYITPKYVKNDKSTGSSQFDLDSNIVFLISLNTHSVDLSQIRMEAVTFIKKEDGGEVQASAWKSVAEGGGHHRSGFVIFPANDRDGKPVTESKSLKVVVKDIAGVNERLFDWTLPIKYR